MYRLDYQHNVGFLNNPATRLQRLLKSLKQIKIYYNL